MKIKIKELISHIDFAVAKLMSLFIKRTSTDKILLIPAADISGGFGEDIMVGSFINHYPNRNIDLIVGLQYNQYYADKSVQYSILYKKIYFTRLVFIMSGYSELHIIGADIMDGFHKEAGKIRFKSLLLARRMGLKVNMTGLSVRKSFPKANQKLFVKYSNYAFIKARDIESFKRLSRFIPENKMILTTDIAFLCPLYDDNYPASYNKTVKWVNSRKNAEKTIVAFCPNSIQMKELGADSYYNLMIGLLNILRNNNCSIILLYHDLRKYALNTSDKDISRHIYEIWKNDDAFFVDDINDGISLKHYLKLADFTFTGRMHFGISGYVCGIPMFGISYLNKFEGLQTMFELSPEETLLDYSNIINEETVIPNYIKHLPLYKDKVKKHLPLIQNLAYKNFN